MAVNGSRYRCRLEGSRNNGALRSRSRSRSKTWNHNENTQRIPLLTNGDADASLVFNPYSKEMENMAARPLATNICPREGLDMPTACRFELKTVQSACGKRSVLSHRKRRPADESKVLIQRTVNKVRRRDRRLCTATNSALARDTSHWQYPSHKWTRRSGLSVMR